MGKKGKDKGGKQYVSPDGRLHGKWADGIRATATTRAVKGESECASIDLVEKAEREGREPE